MISDSLYSQMLQAEQEARLQAEAGMQALRANEVKMTGEIDA